MAVNVSATQTVNLLVDNDGDGLFDVGDTAEFTVTITNSGDTDATDVALNEALDGMTLVPGSVAASAIAFDDAYDAFGNVALSIPAGTGLLANDVEIIGPDTHQVTAFDATSANGGKVSVNADGSFSYTSALGFEGTDTFNYTITDSDGFTSTATVSVDVGPAVWFIDKNAVGSTNVGTQDNPFTSIAAFNAAQGTASGPDSGDVIYLRAGTYTEADGINLANNQTLIGQGQNLVVNGVTIETGSAGQTPTIKISGGGNDGIDLAQNNTISGLNVDTTSGSGIGIDDNGNNVGTLAMSDISVSTSSGAGIVIDQGGTVSVTGAGNTISSTSGTALNITNTTIGVSDVTFQSISANGAVNGIVLNNTGSSGGLTVTGDGGGSNNGSGGTIQNTSGDGISLTATDQVRIGYMNIANNLGDGIGGNDINGFLLTRVNITGNGNDAGADESGINVTELTGGTFAGDNATGIVNSAITNNNEFEVQITNTLGVLVDFQLNNNTISSNGAAINGNASSPHGNLVNFLALGGATMTLNADGGSYTGNWNPASPPATIIATGIQADHSGTGGTVTANVSGASFTNLNVGPQVSNSNGGNIVFDFDGNTITGSRSIAINMFTAANTTGSMVGRIENNTIGTLGVSGSGASIGYPVRIQNEGAANQTILIQNNIIQESASFSAINANIGLSGVATAGGTQNYTILNNVIREVDSGRAIAISQNQDNPDTPAPTTFVNISGNSFSNIAGQAGDGTLIRLREADSGIFKVTQSEATDGAVAGQLDDANNFNDPAKISIRTLNVIDYSQGTPPQPLLASVAVQVLPPGSDGPPASPEGDGAESPGSDSGGTDSTNSTGTIDAVFDAAIARWSAAGLSAAQVAVLEALEVSVEDMGGMYLAAFAPGRITLDDDAFGFGWFVDATPMDDAEFGVSGGPAAGKMDLLTTIMHEMGHALGLSDSYALTDRGELMYGYLTLGERRLPQAGDAAGAVAGSITGEEFLGAPVSVGTLPSGQQVIIRWEATIDPQTGQLVLNPVNQGTVSGTNFTSVLTDDPGQGGASDKNSTALDSLELGGTVFGDLNNNGTLDAKTESGINGVDVSLFADDGDGVWDAGDTLVDTKTTAGGDYQFTGLAAGDYIVVIDESNFGLGGALEVLYSSSPGDPDPDDDVDGDDNGLRSPGNGLVSQAITLAHDSETGADGTGKLDINTTLDFGVLNVAPVITSKAARTVDENFPAGKGIFVAKASDPDSLAAITWSLSGDDAAAFTIDATTGRLKFVASPDYENPSDFDLDRVYDFNVIATDGLLAPVSKAMTITVANVAGLTLNDPLGAGDGKLRGTIEEDTINGLGGNDRLDGGGGSDNLNGGEDNDSLRGGGGADTIDGGTGRDTVRYGADTAAVVDLGNNANNAGSALGDTFTSIENVSGSNGGDDQITGDGKDNRLWGNKGSDTLMGEGGDDRLTGGDDNDDLDGGAGRDRFYGGDGNDVFRFSALSDMGNDATTRDLVFDFVQGEDTIDLSAVAAFTFGAIDGSGARVDAAGDGLGNTIISGDADGNGVADFQILLKGSFTLTASDFTL